MLYQKPGAAHGGGFRMVEVKRHYLISLARDMGLLTSPACYGFPEGMTGKLSTDHGAQAEQIEHILPLDNTGSAATPQQPRNKISTNNFFMSFP